MTARQQTSVRRDLVVIGGSSGALEALKFLGDLPADFPAAIFVVVHSTANGPALLPDILRNFCKMPVDRAYDREPATPGRIYVPSRTLK